MILGGTGHQNIPRTAVDYVRREVRRVVREAQAPIEGISALAVGADQIFAEAVVQAGGRLHVVLPSRGYEKTFEDRDIGRYRALLRNASEVETLDYAEPSEAAFLAAGIRVVDLCNLLLAVWDGREAQGKGGTADVVAHAHRVGKEVEVIWPKGVAR